MGNYSETRYANMIPTFDPAPLTAEEASGRQKTNMRVYETFAALPATSETNGNTAFVRATNKLYAWNGTGWYLVAEVTNASPSSITGVNSTYHFATDGTATTITAVATDPEGFALTWSYAVTTGSLGSTATVSQADNVFTITPSNQQSAAGEFGLTFSVTDGANSAVSYPSAFSLYFGPDPSSYLFSTAGTHSWTCPSGLTKVSVVAVGAGAEAGATAGGGGGLGWKNNISVTPGQSYTVVVGAGGSGKANEHSYFINTTTVMGQGGNGATGGGYVGDGGGNGGDGQGAGTYQACGGGGAGGYSGDGGDGKSGTTGQAGNGQGGGGGGSMANSGTYTIGGGGVGVYGQGTNGVGGLANIHPNQHPTTTSAGTGGSGGGNPSSSYGHTAGGNYGGGGGGGGSGVGGGDAGAGAVRLIWGPFRSFPSTNVSNASNVNAETVV
tara:strand:+ start:543 stop:1862 length:1320 start_codon:yes stop_codon:yes gene_type:complete